MSAELKRAFLWLILLGVLSSAALYGINYWAQAHDLDQFMAACTSPSGASEQQCRCIDQLTASKLGWGDHALFRESFVRPATLTNISGLHREQFSAVALASGQCKAA